ncbi:tetratricopeptide repeat protein [Micromonospora echinospora]|uniref:tetratricopeptide repeat protein n=1 Tax=Micromonospora echinospora TaxID=1877 RepID=UPI001E5DF3D4|nr:tetratricopeptide repeat protein [Micromonospora echinospora]
MTPSGDAITHLLAEAGWQPEQLARRLNECAERHGRPERLHIKTPYKWKKGDVPRSPWPLLTTVLLAEQLQRPITLDDLGWPDDGFEAVPASAGLELPWSPAGALQAGEVVNESEGMMHRRMFLTLLGSALTSPAHEWLIAQPSRAVASTAGRPLSPGVVDHLDAVTASLRRMDDHLGGGQTLGLVRQHLSTVVGVLRDRRYTDSVGRRLHATAGELLRLAGWLSFDDGHHSRAQRFWIAGLYQAHAAGDRGLGANILGFMSCQAKDLGQLRQAVTLAETARSSYPDTSPKVSTILDLRAAEAYANNRSVADTRRALDSAFDRLNDNRPEHGDPDWSYWINEAQAHAQAGYCYVKLKDWPRARDHLRAALRLQENEYTREGALRNALLATTYVQQAHPDLDKALALGDQAVQTLTGQVTSARCIKHVRNLVGALGPYRRTPAVRRFCHDAKDLVAT